MTTLDWLVIIGGAAAIVCVLWYFLWAAPRDSTTHVHHHG